MSNDFFDRKSDHAHRRQSPWDCRISNGQGIVDKSDDEFLTATFVGTSTKISRKSDNQLSEISSECTSEKN